MAKIQVLNQDTINKIAAGEVIERPMAVVKELVENAIDAGANAVTVEIRDGGKSLIRITDNGSGIEKEDILLAFTPHATSKIRDAKDLLEVSTLGFRGEALASVAAISQLEMVTKTRDGFCGFRYLVDGGEEKKLEEVGCPEGTTFLIRNLFYNVPARLKFLKTPQTEAGYISGVLERMALSHPEISFRFINQNQPKLHTSGNGNLKDVIYQIYGRDIASNLLPVSVETESCRIDGYIGKPVVSRGNRAFINYFINGRYIKSATIHQAIENAYASYTMQHRYPFTALHLAVRPECLDVNVHPQKMEVRFTNDRELFHDIFHSLEETLRERELIPEVTFGSQKKQRQETPSDRQNQPSPEKAEENQKNPMEEKTSDRQRQPVPEKMTEQQAKPEEDKSFKFPEQPPCEEASQNQNKVMEKNSGEVYLKKPTAEGIALFRRQAEELKTDAGRQADVTADNVVSQNGGQATDNAVSTNGGQAAGNAVSQNSGQMAEHTPVYGVKQETLFDAGILSGKAKTELQIIGQVFSTYWILQYEDKMYLVDQHAAHEKVLYEQFVRQLREKEPQIQLVRPPIVLTLSMREGQVVEENLSLFTQMGYQIEHFGGREYVVSGVPAQLPTIATKELLLELIDDLVQETGHSTPDMLLERMASMSCKAAVKGNNRLAGEQAEELLRELMTLENPYNCPHGRPTMICMSKREIEKKFKRIV